MGCRLCTDGANPHARYARQAYKRAIYQGHNDCITALVNQCHDFQVL